MNKFRPPTLRPVPPSIVAPDYAESGRPQSRSVRNHMSGEALTRMRRACAAAREILEEVLAAAKPGVRTDELDKIAHEASIARGGYPSPLNYRGYPKSICTSVNEVICHGIPSEQRLEDGDIINCDVTIYLDGMHGDCSETVFIGTPSQASVDLVAHTYRSMMAAIDIVRPGSKLNEIGRVIAKRARRCGYGVVEDFSGHGIGPAFHMPPHVLHYYSRSDPKRMREGMVFTIEPMINIGTAQGRILDDHWTAVTTDGQLSAQFEHTVYVSPRGPEILTAGTPRFLAQLEELGMKPSPAALP